MLSLHGSVHDITRERCPQLTSTMERHVAGIATYLKLALSIQSHPSFTTQRASPSEPFVAGDMTAELHGCVLSGSK